MTPKLPTLDDQISAFMDSELDSSQSNACLDALLSHADARGVWRSYHLVGDALRSGELADSVDDLQFLAKLEARLLHEAMDFPNAIREVLPAKGARLVSANASVFRLRMAAGGALAVVFAVLAGYLLVPYSQGNGVQMVATPKKVQRAEDAGSGPVAIVQDGMIRDPRLDQLLNAHQQLGGHSALQMPSGFLRNATYEGNGR